MKIVLYTHEFLPFAGGIATYCYELACGLSSSGHEVTVVTPKRGPVELNDEPFRVEWIKPHDVPTVLIFRAIKRLHNVLRQLTPEVILVNDRVSLRVASLSHYVRLRARVVPIVHGFRPSHLRYRHSLNPLKRVLEWEMRRFYRSRDLVICVSSHMRSLFLASRFSTPRQRVAVVHNGIKNRFDRKIHDGHRVRQRWNIPSSATVLLTLARLTPTKGQDVVIKALPTVIKEHPDVVYLCAGTGHYRETLASLAVDHGVARNVIFAGQVSNDENKYAYYDACDLFVMPSRFEPFGLAFLEAWHAGKPVLGGNRGGQLEIIEDGVDGVIVEPDDVAAVADSILGLVGNPSRLKEMGRRGRIKASREFSRTVMVDNLVRALRDGRDRRIST